MTHYPQVPRSILTIGRSIARWRARTIRKPCATCTRMAHRPKLSSGGRRCVSLPID